MTKWKTDPPCSNSQTMQKAKFRPTPNKKYLIYLEEQLIGYSLLESANPPMAVIYGTIKESDLCGTYLKALNETQVEIKGIGNDIESMDTDFSTQILGIRAPLCEEEFPHHAYNYKNSAE